MSLVHCPECGHEISANAIACPNCGRPIHTPPVVERPVVERKVVVAPTPVRESGFPPWAFVPIGLLVICLLFVVYLMFRQSGDQANTNVNVNLAGRRPSTEPAKTVNVPPGETQTVTVPGQQTTVPGQTTTVPGTTTTAPVPPMPDKGTVVINAKVVLPRAGEAPAKGVKFYLLDKDPETILSEARIEPIEGNTLTGSLGLAAVFPDRYGDFQRAAMRAIGGHVKYTGTTSGSGGANLAGVAPKEYYLFGIARVGRGFALWSSPVSVIPGENVMNLSPQSITEIQDTSG